MNPLVKNSFSSIDCMLGPQKDILNGFFSWKNVGVRCESLRANSTEYEYSVFRPAVGSRPIGNNILWEDVDSVVEFH